MTCIVALEHEGTVYMGGDSSALDGWDNTSMFNRKVFKIKNMLIGYTSSFRMGQLLQYHLELAAAQVETSDLRYLVTLFIPAVRECLKTGGYTEVKDHREAGGEFLIGWHGVIYRVGYDFQVLGIQDHFAAVGAGEAYALGALAAMQIVDPMFCVRSPEVAIMRTLEIANKFNVAVRGPYYVESMVS